MSVKALSLRLPNSIHRHIKEIAAEEGVSINQFISSAVSEKISAITTENYLLQRADSADRTEFKEILDSVPDRTPIPRRLSENRRPTAEAPIWPDFPSIIVK